MRRHGWHFLEGSFILSLTYIGSLTTVVKPSSTCCFLILLPSFLFGKPHESRCPPVCLSAGKQLMLALWPGGPHGGCTLLPRGGPRGGPRGWLSPLRQSLPSTWSRGTINGLPGAARSFCLNIATSRFQAATLCFRRPWGSSHTCLSSTRWTWQI